MTYGPPEESEQRQAHVSTLVNNLRNMEGDVETGPCGKHSISFLRYCLQIDNWLTFTTDSLQRKTVLVFPIFIALSDILWSVYQQLSHAQPHAASTILVPINFAMPCWWWVLARANSYTLVSQQVIGWMHACVMALRWLHVWQFCLQATVSRLKQNYLKCIIVCCYYKVLRKKILSV